MDIYENIRSIAFQDNVKGWFKRDQHITSQVHSCLNKAGIPFHIQEYEEFQSQPQCHWEEMLCVFVFDSETKQLLRLTKYGEDQEGAFLRRSPSITPGTNLAHGKRGDKMPLEISFQEQKYQGNSYCWDDVTRFIPMD